MSKKHLRFVPLSWAGSLSAPQYQVRFDVQPKLDTRLLMLETRKRLLGTGPVILELDGSFFIEHGPGRQKAVDTLRAFLLGRGIPVRYRFVPAKDSGPIFARIFSHGAQDEVNLLALIDGNLMDDLEFLAALPSGGIRYFRLKPEVPVDTILDGFYTGSLDEEGRLGSSALIVYECEAIGTMGLISPSYPEATLRELVGVT